MSSKPAPIISGSYQSVSTVRDAWESYHRTQSQHADFVSRSISSSSVHGPARHDPEACRHDDDDDDDDDEWQPRRSRIRATIPVRGDDSGDSDDDLTLDCADDPLQLVLPTSGPQHIPSPTCGLDDHVPTPLAHSAERTPLLIRDSSSRPSLRAADGVNDLATSYAAIQRKISSTSLHSETSNKAKYQHRGQSTFTQTLFNAVGVLFGIGMLSQPFAFACAGWVLGTILIVAYGVVSCYTAKILARIVLDDPRISSYADIGRKAFGPRSMPFISLVFGLDLFTVTVALVTLYADSLYTLIPTYSKDTYKILGFLILIPAVLMPLSVLSVASIIGIFSLIAIIGIIIFDGFTKLDSPGSLWSPAASSLGIDNYHLLGIAFGLFMAGFAGHAVIPTLARDMIEPSRFDEMINWAFIIATGIYGLLGVVGYIMFGNAVSDEFSVDLMKYNTHPALNTIALWGLVITPLSKYALSARPVNVTIETLLGIDGCSDLTTGCNRTAYQKVLVAIERIVFTFLSVAVSILVPEFASVMAVLGATFSFLLGVIGPLSAKIALDGGIRKCGWRDGALLGVAVSMAVWGTFCAFESAIREGI